MSSLLLVLNSTLLLGQANSAESTTGVTDTLIGPLLTALVFSVLGVVVLLLSFWGVTRVLPFSIREEIEHDQNTALAIVIGSAILGLSIIIAAAILG